MDLVHGPPSPPYGPPIKRQYWKITIRDLSYRLFCFVFLPLFPPSLWRWKEDLRTSKKTDKIANLCFSLRNRCHRLPPPFCSAHSPACSLTRPRLHKIVLRRQRKMPMSIQQGMILCRILKSGTSHWTRGGMSRTKWRRQSERIYKLATLSVFFVGRRSSFHRHSEGGNNKKQSETNGKSNL